MNELEIWKCSVANHDIRPAKIIDGESSRLVTYKCQTCQDAKEAAWQPRKKRPIIDDMRRHFAVTNRVNELLDMMRRQPPRGKDYWQQIEADCIVNHATGEVRKTVARKESNE